MLDLKMILIVLASIYAIGVLFSFMQSFCYIRSCRKTYKSDGEDFFFECFFIFVVSLFSWFSYIHLKQMCEDDKNNSKKS